jgi:hypothetical protein
MPSVRRSQQEKVGYRAKTTLENSKHPTNGTMKDRNGRRLEYWKAGMMESGMMEQR